MTSAAKLVAFAAVVAAVFGGAMVVGAAVGPIDVGDGAHGSGHAGAGAEGGALPRGLSVALGGHRLALATTTLPAGTPSTLSFQIVDDRGAAITDYEELHERPLHLIVLSRNLVDYHHLHPQLDAAGTWTVDVPALPPGSYRAFADFQPAGGENLTLGADLSVPGTSDAEPTPAPAATATVDGYEITLTGEPAAAETELSFSVALDGAQVRTDPYLGAAGHLVAIRAGDLAYLHVHPHEDGTSSAVTFTADLPTPGTYRLFFDFSHDGTVRTAAFTVVVPDVTGDSPLPPGAHEGGR